MAMNIFAGRNGARFRQFAGSRDRVGRSSRWTRRGGAQEAEVLEAQQRQLLGVGGNSVAGAAAGPALGFGGGWRLWRRLHTMSRRAMRVSIDA